MQMSGIRQLLGGLVFVIFFMAKGHGFPEKKQWKSLIVLSILMFTLSNGLSTMGVKHIGSGLAAIIGSITALWLAVFSYLILKQKVFNRMVIGGLLTGFAGVSVIFYEHLKDFVNPDFTVSILFSLAATITWALGTVYTIRNARFGNAYYNTGWQMFLSGIMMSALAYTQKRTPLYEITTAGWIDFAYLVTGGSILTFVAYMYALRHLPVAKVSVYVYINPIVAVILGHLWLGEPVTATLGIGAGITLLGVYLVNEGTRKRQLQQEQPL